MITIAIQPDEVFQPNGVRQWSSERWLALSAESGIATQIVDAYAPDLSPGSRGATASCGGSAITRPSVRSPCVWMQAVEQSMGIPVFPSRESAWHLEGKIAQVLPVERGRYPDAADVAVLGS